MSRTWEVDFVALSLALGEPLPSILHALGDGGVLRADWLLERLDTRVKTARALALASVLAELVTDFERMELR